MNSFLPFSKRLPAVLIIGSLLTGTLLAAPAKGIRYDGQSIAAKAAKSPRFITELAGPSNSFEIKLQQPLESSYIDGAKRIDNTTGYPAAIYDANYRVRSAAPETQAREYLAANSGLFGLTAGDLSGLSLHAVRADAAGTVVRLRQTWMGLAVNKNAEITVHINPDNIVDFVMNGFQYGIALQDTTPMLAAADARRTVMDHFGSLAGRIEYEKSELMVLHYQGNDYLVHRINMEMNELPGEWEAFVDAKTGALLKLEDISHYRHAKTAKGAAVPEQVLVNGLGNVFDPDPLTTSTQAYGGGYVDNSDANSAALTAELKNVPLLDITFSGGNHSLVGPWAEIVDFEAPSKGLFAQPSSTFNFDRVDDGFEAVNTYYHIDNTMRWLNTSLGLNIHPYQYAGGVQFDPSGFNGADNSHYLSGSGRLAFGEGGVDDAEDADVIVHELGHGLHDWVTAGGLSQVNGLSEGTGDYIAGSYSRARGHWTSANAAYFWTFNWDGHNPFWDGRLLNYSATYPGGLTGQIHTDGQIWATANMKIWDDIGREKSDRAFFTGLAMTNSGTNQNDAANAIFTASGTLGYSFEERTAIRNRFVAAGYTIPEVPPPPPPPITGANVSGRVLANASYGLQNATVIMINNTTSTRKIAYTSALGYFSFYGVTLGQSYTVEVKSKRFTYTPQTMTVNGDLSDLSFTPAP
jgi:Zn-dependent metalloprotease